MPSEECLLLPVSAEGEPTGCGEKKKEPTATEKNGHHASACGLGVTGVGPDSHSVFAASEVSTCKGRTASNLNEVPWTSTLQDPNAIQSPTTMHPAAINKHDAKTRFPPPNLPCVALIVVRA